MDSCSITKRNSTFTINCSANTTPNAREPFLAQFDQIVNSLATTRQRVEARRQSEKVKRDALNQQQLEAADKQRLYYKCLKEFTDECRKNEMLVEQLNAEKANTPIDTSA